MCNLHWIILRLNHYCDGHVECCLRPQTSYIEFNQAPSYILQVLADTSYNWAMEQGSIVSLIHEVLYRYCGSIWDATSIELALLHRYSTSIHEYWSTCELFHCPQLAPARDVFHSFNQSTQQPPSASSFSAMTSSMIGNAKSLLYACGTLHR